MAPSSGRSDATCRPPMTGCILPSNGPLKDKRSDNPLTRLLGGCCDRRSFLGRFRVARPRRARGCHKPPAPDDRFAFLTGPKKGQLVRAEDLALGGPQVQAFPMAPDGTVRGGSRLNLVILARFDPAALTDETRARAADGVVAYSAICTHQGCPVNMWSKERNAFVCSCHASIFRSRNGCRGVIWAGSASPRGARAEAQ